MKKLALAIGALALLILAAPFAQATPHTGTLFNYPKDYGGTMASSYVELNRLARMVDETPRGAIIYVSMFTANRWWAGKGSQPGESLMIKLAKAKDRGVAVRYVTWTSDLTSPVKRLRSKLGTNTRAKSWFKACHDACRSNAKGGAHHTKAFTFSRTGGKNWVTTIMSGNLTRAATERQWNESTTIVGDERIYRAVTANIASMRFDRPMPAQKSVRSGSRAVYFYPQPKHPQDPELAAMRAVKCRYGNGKVTRIRIPMAFWTGPRHKFTDEVVKKRKQHCDVQVIVSKGLTSKSVMTKLRKGKVPTWNSMPNKSHYGHQKTVMIGGMIGKRGDAVVFSGSSNMTGAGLTKNDDLILEQHGWPEYAAHDQAFKVLRAHSTRLPTKGKKGW